MKRGQQVKLHPKKVLCARYSIFVNFRRRWKSFRKRVFFARSINEILGSNVNKCLLMRTKKVVSVSRNASKFTPSYAGNLTNLANWLSLSMDISKNVTAEPCWNNPDNTFSNNVQYLGTVKLRQAISKQPYKIVQPL
jgi:hypothetical protein